MPNNNNQQNSQSFPNDVQNTEDPIPVLAIESESPPILQDQITTPIQTSNEDVKTQDKNTDVGSAAPSADIVMPPVITSQRKKFPGGKVIATILGLFLLVGGLGAGILLVDQNQNINEEAAQADGCKSITDKNSCNNSCGTKKADGKSYRCRWTNAGSCSESGQECGTGGGDTKTVCENQGGVWCSEVTDYLGKPVPAFCNTSGVTCGNAAGDLGYIIRIGIGMCIPGNSCPPFDGGWLCVIGVNGYTGGQCTEENSSDDMAYGKPPDCFCGTLQIDGGPYDGTYVSKCGCDKKPTAPPSTPVPTPGPTRQPSPPATISASCQNLLAYDTNWKLYRPEQLSLLKPGQNLYFCVTGSASSGYFDKAKFTINGEQFSETTTKRPNSDDYCQLYTIKSGISRHDVSAQIHHITLGWK